MKSDRRAGAPGLLMAVAIDSITDGILAHEIAHAVISAYFVVPPSARMQEILCRQMDKNIREK